MIWSCGDGRDSYFFSSHGFQTIGIDGSLEAINNCKQNFNHELLDFFCYDIEEQSLYEKIKEIITSQNKKLVFYSRFFLHAINDNQQNILLNSLKKIKDNESLCFFLNLEQIEMNFKKKQLQLIIEDTYLRLNSHLI